MVELCRSAMRSSSFSVASQRARDAITGFTRWMCASRTDHSIGGTAIARITTAAIVSINVNPRAFRRLGADRMDLRLGPIAPQILEGMRRWRYVLEPNDWEIAFEIEFTDTTRQVFREPTLPIDRGFPS